MRKSARPLAPCARLMWRIIIRCARSGSWSRMAWTSSPCCSYEARTRPTAMKAWRR
ncbi:Uncharacterised protein [Bordetella pertussis]|nr:Uncharacterised protein [Bordetella pertussis]